MSKRRNYVFVLWGDGFDEVAATVFVTQLREVGLRVKIVSLTLQHICGAHGLTILPDLTLDEALPLAVKAICIFIPYSSPGIIRLKSDPRLRELFRMAQINKARFVTGPLNKTDLADLRPVITGDIIIYPNSEDLVTFAREVADLLLDTTS